jgi:hypothetical protein
MSTLFAVIVKGNGYRSMTVHANECCSMQCTNSRDQEPTCAMNAGSEQTDDRQSVLGKKHPHCPTSDRDKRVGAKAIRSFDGTGPVTVGTMQVWW